MDGVPLTDADAEPDGPGRTTVLLGLGLAVGDGLGGGEYVAYS